MDGGDWRNQLQPDSRQRIVNKIMETLKRHLPVSGQEGLEELKEIAIRFEEKTYSVATNQSDYLRKISLKMLTMESKSQNTLPNAMPSNAAGVSRNPQDPAAHSSMDEDSMNVENLVHEGDDANAALKRKSPMWRHFIPVRDASGNVIQKTCMYCGTILTQNSNNGTSSMKKHLNSCKKYPRNTDPKQRKIYSFQSTSIATVSSNDNEYDPEAIRVALAKMVIIDEQPFSFAEHQGFREFCSVAIPRFNVPSRFTLARDCKKIYVGQKEMLKCHLHGLRSRIALTTDCWTSIQNLSYLCLTAHFIDDNWTLHKRILNFKVIDSHKGKEVGKVVEKCVLDWGIEDKLSAITVDNASSNDVALQYLKENMSNKFVLDGEYFHMRCCAHVLNLVVRDGLSLMKESIVRIRTAVRFVRSSPSRMRIFDICVAREKIPFKNSLCLDLTTRWNSTYLMLEVALKFQRAFARLSNEDNTFVNELEAVGGVPRKVDWERAQVLCQFLKHFHDATKRMSGTLYSTSNQHFHELFLILTTLIEWELDPNEVLNDLAKKMKHKFELYYGDFKKKTNIMVLVAVVLDPRYKLRFVRYALKQLYPDEPEKVGEIYDNVSSIFTRLYDFYASNCSVGAQKVDESSCSYDLVPNVVLAANKHYNNFLREEDDDFTVKKSEIDKYLESPLLEIDSTFDILSWWRERDAKKTYPILASVAKDILAIPVSIVSSESAFSTSGRVLDQYRSSLGPKTIEILICAQDWLRSSKIVDYEQMMDDIRQFEKEFAEGDGEVTEDEV